jgi:hypothetical protein
MDEPLTMADVREFLLSLPGVEEGTSYGAPAFRIRGKALAGLKAQDGVVGLRMGFDEREMWMQVAPEAFFVTAHYRAHPSVLVRIGQVDPDLFRRLIVQRWRDLAPKALVKAFDMQNR